MTTYTQGPLTMKAVQYAVFSYNPDQQQHYCDYMLADSYQQATEFVMDSRPYVHGADAYTGPDLRAIADDLEAATNILTGF
jgi:hypothetical protein